MLEAISQGSSDEVNRLLSDGAKAQSKDDQGVTALLLSLRTGNSEIAKALIEHGADVTQIDQDGNSVIMNAIINNLPDIGKLCIEKYADVNISNNYSNTPLLLASSKGFMEVVELLIDKGADVTAKDNKGYNALQLAEAGNHASIASILKVAMDENEATVAIQAKNNLKAKRARGTKQLVFFVILLAIGVGLFYKAYNSVPGKTKIMVSGRVLYRSYEETVEMYEEMTNPNNYEGYYPGMVPVLQNLKASKIKHDRNRIIYSVVGVVFVLLSILSLRSGIKNRKLTKIE